MSDWQPEHWIAVGGVGTGLLGGGGLLGWFGGRRRSKAETALSEVLVAKETIAVLREGFEELRTRVDRQGEEITELKFENRNIKRERDVLLEFVDDAFQHYDANPSEVYPLSLPGNRLNRVLAIVRPELAKLLTAEVPIQTEES